MVYGGKPSRGCRTCRARRIKCDEGKPTCNQCAKSKRECAGYRNEFEIVHRDQTKSTVRRMNKALNQSRSAPSTSNTVATTSTTTTPPKESSPPSHLPSPRPSPTRQQTPDPIATLTVPLTQRAACYFAANFLYVPLGQMPHGFMDYLVPLIDAEPPDSSLRSAFNACAIAAFGNREKANSLNLANVSLREHTLALAKTHAALGNPATANSDRTLATVLLLGLYESITAVKETRMLAWRSHVDGAIQIVKMRGREQMRSTKTGTLLFQAVRHQVLGRALTSGMPPPFGVDWWMDGVGDGHLLPNAMHRFALQVSELRAEASALLAGITRTAGNIALMHQMAHRVRLLDQEIASWLLALPPNLRFKTLCWLSPEEVGLTSGRQYPDLEAFPGRIDMYPDFVTAGIWNTARTVRLVLASINIRITAWLNSPADYRTTAEYATSKAICEGTIAEVISSVPYHLGWHTKQEGLFDNDTDRSGFACGQENTIKALPAWFLIWTLTCVKNHDMTSDEQRIWVKGRLRFIGDHVGLKYAHVVNDLELRFPSMFIRQDGAMPSTDPLRAATYKGLPVPVSEMLNINTASPRTPESVGSEGRDSSG
ncbi:hypothetical protein B0T20DRAFT_50313 [Sordaria brevicollis]|uniref:Zn(2)-C6 fungal-type domain-containing protein n=1 Tax=Sordaria brevicollis TaxID=83679 RepID=A0AAE0P2N0_SORBR|nr:hypothetical protein B0T20DRAFT_50313 [Sordaria brevicollis]